MNNAQKEWADFGIFFTVLLRVELTEKPRVYF